VKLHPATGIRHPDSIKNIIFDFGGVICNLDVQLTERRFRELGMTEFDPAYSLAGGESIFSVFERGAITPGQFREGLRKSLPPGVTDAAIDEAWNAMLLDIPPDRIRLLQSLRDRYRIFLLSNSNEIHYQCYLARFREQFGYDDFDALFEKAYFSFHLKMQKPEPGIFEYVINQHSLHPNETLFIDDSPRHAEGARRVFIHGILLSHGTDLISLFEEENTE
jgi:FMN phosphatase YigB (HAD superfamily)